jgi:signal transduction histidine kinase
MDEKGELLAYLYIIIQGEVYDDAASLINANKTWWVSLSIIAAALAFLLVTTLLLFYQLTRPLVRLNKEVATFERSGFQQLLTSADPLPDPNSKSNDELQALRGSFYRMGTKIVDQISYLKKHDKMRREFLAHVSHDLRTPLAGMRAYLETLQLEGDKLSEADRHDFLEKALLTNHKLTGMIDEVFELARLEHGQIAVNPELIGISDLLSDLYASLSGLANNKGVHLAVEMEDESINVFADVARLDRVLQNLVGNAILYTPAGGTVTIQVNNEPNLQVRLAIQDTGQGIAPEDLPYVFEPYFRATNGAQAYHEGKGLGLAIASKLLALHESELTVSSELGKGARFEFLLPAS